MQFTRCGAWPLWFVVAWVGFSALGEPHPLSAEEPKERASLGGHTAVVASIALTADGKTLACGIGYGAVKLWDVGTGRERASIEAHRARVWALVFSPDGKTLASGAWDGSVKLWDVGTGQERAHFAAHDNRVYALAFAADGKTLVSGGGIQFKRGEAKLWDVAAILKSDGNK
jgi:WD40 repeat protein